MYLTFYCVKEYYLSIPKTNSHNMLIISILCAIKNLMLT